MTLCSFGANTGQKRAKYGGHFEIQNYLLEKKNGSNWGFALKGIWKVKSIGSTSIASFALDYITPCTIRQRGK